MTEKRVFYINIGTTTPLRANQFLERIKEQLKEINQDTEDYLIPIREGCTRMEIYTKDDKDKWVQENPIIVEALQTARIIELETKLEAAQRQIEALRGDKNWLRKYLPNLFKPTIIN